LHPRCRVAYDDARPSWLQGRPVGNTTCRKCASGSRCNRILTCFCDQILFLYSVARLLRPSDASRCGDASVWALYSTAARGILACDSQPSITACGIEIPSFACIGSLKSPCKTRYNFWRKLSRRRLTIINVVVTASCSVQVTCVTVNHAQFATLPPWRGYTQYRNVFWSLNRDCSGANKVARSRGPTCFHVAPVAGFPTSQN
jgi:hypothetical protein